MPAMPLDPVLLHYFVHDCDLNSIHADIMEEWHPELKQTISNWLSLGPDDDISGFRDHLATYHDKQVCTLALT